MHFTWIITLIMLEVLIFCIFDKELINEEKNQQIENILLWNHF